MHLLKTGMKKHLLSYLFFTIYLLTLVKPMFPVLDYIANYDYIATQLCENRDKPILDCNGKCYVAKKIENNNPQSDHNLVPIVEFEKYVFKEFQLDLKSELIQVSTNSSHYYYLQNFNDAHLSALFRPPIV